VGEADEPNGGVQHFVQLRRSILRVEGPNCRNAAAAVTDKAFDAPDDESGGT
jgi:hypothetical protein